MLQVVAFDHVSNALQLILATITCCLSEASFPNVYWMACSLKRKHWDFPSLKQMFSDALLMYNSDFVHASMHMTI